MLVVHANARGLPTMPRATNKLTVRQIEAAKPADRPLKLSDGGGMFLLVQSDGARWWRLSYRYGGKQKTISPGVYPEAGLKAAREARDAASARLAQGTDPSVERKVRKAALAEDSLKPSLASGTGANSGFGPPGMPKPRWPASRPGGHMTSPGGAASSRARYFAVPSASARRSATRPSTSREH